MSLQIQLLSLLLYLSKVTHHCGHAARIDLNTVHCIAAQ